MTLIDSRWISWREVVVQTPRAKRTSGRSAAAGVEPDRNAFEVGRRSRVAREHERIVPRHDRVVVDASRRSVAQPSTIASTSYTIGNGRPVSKFS